MNNSLNIGRFVFLYYFRWFYFNIGSVFLNKQKNNGKTLFIFMLGFYQDQALFDYIWKFGFRISIYPFIRDELGIYPGFSITIPTRFYAQKRLEMHKKYRLNRL